jgi:3-oxoacyl-[acyl-carrier protein] reductase
MDLQLRDKVGIVTGASQGIGAAIARALGREGCKLVLAARSTGKLKALADEIGSLGGQAAACTADLMNPSAAAPLVEAALKEFGRLDFVVTNAGVAKTGDFLQLTDKDWDEGFGLKFFAHMRLLRAAWPHLKASRGSVVIIAGAAGRTPSADSLITGSVNSALMNFTKGLADRGLADGVRVNAVLPGPIRTERWLGRLDKVIKAQGISAADAERRMIDKGRVTRIGEPEDVASVVAFALSPHGSYMHGALIDVDGGRTKGV